MNNQEKLAKLYELKLLLKKEFVGLDVVIDRLIDSLTTWYIYRDSFTHPYPICIWGPTGTGKTKMVKMITDFLKFNSVNLDARSFLDSEVIYLRPKFDSVTIDEIQNIGSKNPNGSHDRKTKNKSKEIWNFLSEGTSDYDSDYLKKALQESAAEAVSTMLETITSTNRLETLEKTHQYMVTKAEDLRFKLLKEFSYFLVEKSNSFLSNPITKISEANLFFTSLRSFYTFNEDKPHEISIEDEHERKTSFSRTFYNDHKLHHFVLKPIPKCNPVVFILGNLDSIYNSFLDNNVKTDLIKDKILNFSNNDIIEELSKLFFPEEISRLGKNQILFPVLNRSEYETILSRKIDMTCSNFKNDKLNISFTEDLKQFIYQELIDPRYGVRAIDSSYRSLIESTIMSSVLKYSIGSKATDFILDLKPNSRTIVIKADTNELQIQIPEMNHQDELNPPELQNQIATHEAGHALAFFLLKKRPPEYIRTKLSSSEVGGFVNIAPDNKRMATKKSYIEDLQVLLAGAAAEKVIFESEDEIMAGSYSDISKATGLAQQMIMSLGMGKNRISYNMNEGSIRMRSYEEEVNKEILELVKTAEESVTKLLTENKDKLKKLIECLNTRTFLSGEEMEKLLT